MAFRADISVDWDYSPRLIWVHWVDAATRELTLQDLYDTMKTLEALTANMDNDFLGNAEGLTPLGGGQSVAITVTLNNALVAFDPNEVEFLVGTATEDDPTGEFFTDAAAHFITDGLTPGSVLDNHTDHSHCTVMSVLSETQLRTTHLYGGITGEWHVGDVYDIHEVLVCSLTGGNLVANDAFGGQFKEPCLPTSNIFVTKTSSASATLLEQDAMRYASYGDQVTVDLINGEPGTEYPVCTKEHPGNSVISAMIIANDKGFDTLQFIGDGELLTGHDVAGKTIKGSNVVRTRLSIEPGALTLDCELRDATVAGTLDGNTLINSCRVEDLDYVEGQIEDCLIQGTIILMGAGDTQIIGCHGAEAGDPASYPVIKVGAGRILDLQGYGGGIRISEVGAGAVAICNMRSGHVIVDASCSAGVVIVRGQTAVTDSHTGTCVVDTSAVIAPLSVTESTYYQGFVNIDAAAGVDGTRWPAGMPGSPVQTLACAKALMAYYNIRGLRISGLLLLTESLTNVEVIGVNVLTDIVHFGLPGDGQDVSGSTFRLLTLTGEQGAGTAMFNAVQCLAASLTGVNGLLSDCGIDTSIAVGGIGSAILISDGKFLSGGVAAGCIFDLVGPYRAVKIQGGGDVVFKNLVADGYTSAGMGHGRVTLEPSCTGSAILLQGTGDLTDHSDGTYVINEMVGNAAVADAVWDEADAGHVADGSKGKVLHDAGVDAAAAQVAAAAAEVEAGAAHTAADAATVAALAAESAADAALAEASLALAAASGALAQATRARKYLTNKDRLQEGSTRNRTIYDDDGIAVLAVESVVGPSGEPIVLQPGSPASRTPEAP